MSENQEAADLLAALEQLKGDYERLQGKYLAVKAETVKLKETLKQALDYFGGEECFCPAGCSGKCWRCSVAADLAEALR